jgi:hypothetical protein
MWRTSVATSMVGRSDEEQIEVTLQSIVMITLAKDCEAAAMTSEPRFWN